MIFLYLALTADCLALSLGDYRVSLSSQVTAWAGNTVNINCTVHTDNDQRTVIIWLREHENRSEVLAHDDQIFPTEAGGETKFQVLTESRDGSMVSQLSMFNSRVSDSSSLTCVATDPQTGREGRASSRLVIFDKVNLVADSDTRSQKLLPYTSRAGPSARGLLLLILSSLISLLVSR